MSFLLSNILKADIEALTSPTSGGRSVGIVRWRTKASEFVCFLFETEATHCKCIQWMLCSNLGLKTGHLE
jgi:hypothetical protein